MKISTSSPGLRCRRRLRESFSAGTGATGSAALRPRCRLQAAAADRRDPSCCGRKKTFGRGWMVVERFTGAATALSRAMLTSHPAPLVNRSCGRCRAGCYRVCLVHLHPACQITLSSCIMQDPSSYLYQLCRLWGEVVVQATASGGGNYPLPPLPSDPQTASHLCTSAY
jgi:hypothetical protein